MFGRCYSHPGKFGPCGNSDHRPHCILLRAVVQNYPEQVDQLRKLAYVFYTSTRSLCSFFVPYIELGSCLQSKFNLKRSDEVKKDGHFPGGSLLPLFSYCHSCNIFQPLVPFY